MGWKHIGPLWGKSTGDRRISLIYRVSTMRRFDSPFVASMDKLWTWDYYTYSSLSVNKQSSYWWFETPWRVYDVTVEWWTSLLTGETRSRCGRVCRATGHGSARAKMSRHSLVETYHKMHQNVRPTDGFTPWNYTNSCFRLVLDCHPLYR